MSSTVATSSLASSHLEYCSYQRHVCSRRRYLNYRYCAQHIVEDEKSPFTSCEYLSRTTRRKCPNPALRPRKQNSLPIFCSEHLHELIVKEKHQKQKRKLRRKRKIQKESLTKSESAKRQKLVNQLYKYSEETPKTADGQLNHEESESDVEDIHRPINDEWPLENSACIGTDADWDDFDPVNNEVYEPLRYADVLTPEEVVATAQSKLIRLQSLYIEQFKRLFHLLEERRRQYLQDLKSELKEEKANSGFAKQDAEFEEKVDVHALAMCGKRTGVNALLWKRQLQKRRRSAQSAVSVCSRLNPCDVNYLYYYTLQQESYSSKPTSAQRCAHASNHARCKTSCLPYTKYCPSHILEDPHQLLYKKCHDALCPLPVNHLLARPYPNDAVDGPETGGVYYCTLHAPLPEMTFNFPDIVTKDEKLMEASMSPEDDPIEQLYRYVVKRDRSTATMDNSTVGATESGVFKNSESVAGQSLKDDDDDVVTDSVDAVTLAAHPGSDISNAKDVDPDYHVDEQIKSLADSSPVNVPSKAGEQGLSPNSDDKNILDIGESVDSCIANTGDSTVTAEDVDAREIVPPMAPDNTSVICVDDKVLSNDQSRLSVDDEHTVSEQGALRHKNLAISTNSDAVLLDIDAVSIGDTAGTADDVALGMPADDIGALESQEWSSRVRDDTEHQSQTPGAVANSVGDLGSQKMASSSVDSCKKSSETASTDRQGVACGQSNSAVTVVSDTVFLSLQSDDEPLTVSENAIHQTDKSETPESSTPSLSTGLIGGDNDTAKSAVTGDATSASLDENTTPAKVEELPGDAKAKSLTGTEPSEEASKIECQDSAGCRVPAGNEETESLLNDEEEISKDDASSPPDNASGFVSQPGERKPSSVEEEMAVVSLVRLCTGHHSDEATSSSTDQD